MWRLARRRTWRPQPRSPTGPPRARAARTDPVATAATMKLEGPEAMHADREVPYPSRAKAVYIVAVLFLVWFMAYMDRQVIGLLVPSLKASLHLSDTQVSLLQGIAFALVFSVSGVPFG